MRRFVIIEKHRPWLWDEDVILCHDRDFIVVRAHKVPNNLLQIEDEAFVKDNTFYRAFMLFDKNVLEKLSMDEITAIAITNRVDYYHNGLPYCSNKRIFAPPLRAYTDIDVELESIIRILRRKRDEILKTVKTFVKI